MATKRRVSKGSQRRHRGARVETVRRRILDAALKDFKTKGYSAATIKSISRRAGVSEQAFAKEFGTKEDVTVYFFEVCARDAMSSVARDTHVRRAPLKEKLFAIISRQLETLSPHKEIVREVLAHAWLPTSKLNPLSLESLQLTVDYLTEVKTIIEQSERTREIPNLGGFGPYVFGLFYLGILTFWLYDASKAEEDTLSLLDQSLNLIFRLLGDPRSGQ